RGDRMTSLAIDNIGLLITNDPSLGGKGPLGELRDAAVVFEDGAVVAVERAGVEADERLDAGGRCVMPGFVDSHTHLVFAGDRAEEFALRMAGRPYQPGGILETVSATRSASGQDLKAGARRLIHQARASGTTTIEIKTGYGLTPEHESAHLEIARALTTEATFLG